MENKMTRIASSYLHLKTHSHLCHRANPLMHEKHTCFLCMRPSRELKHFNYWLIEPYIGPG